MERVEDVDVLPLRNHVKVAILAKGTLSRIAIVAQKEAECILLAAV